MIYNWRQFLKLFGRRVVAIKSSRHGISYRLVHRSPFSEDWVYWHGLFGLTRIYYLVSNGRMTPCIFAKLYSDIDEEWKEV